MMDLSHSVDDVVHRNLAGLKNVDVIQCSIDAPLLRDQCIDGMVYCHNVIQHTPSVEKTAHALFALTAPGGEFVFNCYPLNDQGCGALGTLPPGLQAAAGGAVAYAVCCDHVLCPVDGLVALGARLGPPMSG